MIPKAIHYFWFGNSPMPEKSLACIASWKKYCPNYEIKCWNEENYDYHKNAFLLKAARDGKWSFVSDYARLDVLYRYGGIYLDTDVELVKPLDDLLNYRAFFGFETENMINTGHGFGAEAGLLLLKSTMKVYDGLCPAGTEEDYVAVVSPKVQTPVMAEAGFKLDGTKQEMEGILLLPTNAFCPLEFDTGKLNMTADTYCIHWYHATWKSLADRKVMELQQKLTPYFGKKNAARIAVMIQYPRYKGIKETVKYYLNKLR